MLGGRSLRQKKGREREWEREGDIYSIYTVDRGREKASERERERERRRGRQPERLNKPKLSYVNPWQRKEIKRELLRVYSHILGTHWTKEKQMRPTGRRKL